MSNNEKEVLTMPAAKKHQNDVNVNNHFSLTINFGDSLNLIALIAGVYFIRKLAKKTRNQKLANKKAF